METVFIYFFTNFYIKNDGDCLLQTGLINIRYSVTLYTYLILLDMYIKCMLEWLFISV